jgi:hypothetical protein
MPRLLKALALSATLIVGSVALAATTTASAESPPPSIVKTWSPGTIYPCSNGTCTIGPGNTGMPFAAALIGTGGPPYNGPESNAYKMSVVSGSLPPGLRLALPDTEWMILGTPTKAGTYTFTIQIAALAGGPDSFEQFSITIGTGSSDRLVITEASYLVKFVYLRVAGFDVNVGATYTVYSGKGADLGTLRFVNSGDGEPFNGDGRLLSNLPISPPSLQETVTVKDSLGGSVTVPIKRVNPYK